MWNWLKRWLAGRRLRPDLHFVFFTRKGCHLCDEALATLRVSQKEHRFALDVRDVDANSEWVAKYDKCVPVVEVNGKVRFRGGVNRVLLRRLLDAKADSDAC
jgi:glutaredoxin